MVGKCSRLMAIEISWEFADSMSRLHFFNPCRVCFVRLALSFGALLLMFGCGLTVPDHPPVYSVKGKVLYKGKPVSSGVVLFELEGSDPTSSTSAIAGGPLSATGRIEPDGSFQLIAYQGTEEVPAGQYKVGVSSVPARTESNIFDSAASVKKGNPDVLRGRYSDPKTSGLRTEVLKDQTNEPTFDLK
jgi:hypothetical protein